MNLTERIEKMTKDCEQYKTSMLELEMVNVKQREQYGKEIDRIVELAEQQKQIDEKEILELKEIVKEMEKRMKD